LVEHGNDIGRLEHRPRPAGHEQSRVIVDHVQDLDVTPVGELPVGDVSLPALVRHLGLESDE
jgi:hypothetical protein